ncbi:plasmid mobilization relaxosome protein MobC [Desulfosarcina cetonica]|uniref:plasmid mobilization relaxosome protein MobC n=1 Tax=Desulfosarcina cetonica TaxID=90730 RepID=UPI001C43CAC3|nr:plasmid mobilization relaxosome protein MobC [Desulfosarcina cetonica]
MLIFKEDMPELPKRRTREQMADPQRKELSKLLGTLGKSRISQNINQLAKAANSGSLPVNHEVAQELNNACDAIRWMRQTLIKAMGLKPLSDPEMTQREERHDP